MSTPHPRPLTIALLGTRGVPARYGGFETFAEQLSRRLAGRGHRMIVYRRSRYADGDLAGVEVVTLPALYTKHLETVSHTFLSALHCASIRPDVALVCNAVNALFLPLLRAAGIPAALNVDGIEWQRRKWSLAGRTMHRLAEHLAVAQAECLIADAWTIRDDYALRHGAETVFIPYGGDLEPPGGDDCVRALGLEPGGYDLCVCRFEPENHPLLVVQAHALLADPLPLVVVGGATYDHAYEREVRRDAGPAVHFAGFRFGEAYRQFLFHSRALIFAGEVGGTHPVLVEAMGAGKPIVYLDTPANRETVGEAGLAYPRTEPAALAAAWRGLDESGLAEARGRRGRARVDESYLWETVTDAYEDLLGRLARREPAAPPRAAGFLRAPRSR